VDHDPGEIQFQVLQPEVGKVTAGPLQKVPGRPPISPVILRPGGRTEFRADGDRVAHRHAAVTAQPERGRQMNAHHAEPLVAEPQGLGNRVDVQSVQPDVGAPAAVEFVVFPSQRHRPESPIGIDHPGDGVGIQSRRVDHDLGGHALLAPAPPPGDLENAPARFHGHDVESRHHLRARPPGQTGQSAGVRGGVHDAGGGRVERRRNVHIGLQGPDAGPVQPTRPRHPVGLRLGAHRVQPGQLVGRGGHHEFTHRGVRHAMAPAEFVHETVGLGTQGGFDRPGRVIDSGVDDAGVAARLGFTHTVQSLEQKEVRDA